MQSCHHYNFSHSISSTLISYVQWWLHVMYLWQVNDDYIHQVIDDSMLKLVMTVCHVSNDFVTSVESLTNVIVGRKRRGCSGWWWPGSIWKDTFLYVLWTQWRCVGPVMVKGQSDLTVELHTVQHTVCLYWDRPGLLMTCPWPSSFTVQFTYEVKRFCSKTRFGLIKVGGLESIFYSNEGLKTSVWHSSKWLQLYEKYIFFFH